MNFLFNYYFLMMQINDNDKINDEINNQPWSMSIL